MEELEIPLGLRGSITREVTEDMSADRLGLSGAHVLASPMLGLLFEQAAIEALGKISGPPVKTLGVKLELSHDAPTPVGFEVTVEATLVEVDGRRLRFAVEARDNLEQIGSGTHDRVIVDWDRFLASVAKKRDSA